MPNFNGETLIITLDLGVTEVDIQDDLYSDWKDWLTSGTTGENRRYPQAFRVVGGDNLTPGIKAGAYFFLQNQSGWRIKPAEKDETVLLTGNLAPEDSALPMLVPTNGDFSVLVAGLQPITQSVEEILVQGQTAEYSGIVAVDFVNGTSGNAYPQGLRSDPVDNVIDAFLVALRIKSKTFEISNGTFNLDRDALSYTFIDGGGQGGVGVTGYNVGGSKFLGTTLLNTSFSATTSGIKVIGSNIVSVSDFRGQAENCGIIGTITLQPQLTTFTSCFSIDTMGLNVIFDCQSGSSQLNTSVWSGTFTLKNTGTGFTGNINVDSAEIILDQSCSEGVIEVRGVGFLDDLSAGITINRQGFISGEDIIQLRNFIYIDNVNGVSGTTENIGISTNPVNNIADAYLLSLKRKTTKFKIKTEDSSTPIILDRDFDDYEFSGLIGKNTAAIDFNGKSVNHCVFDTVNITGQGSGEIVGRGLDVVNISGVSGVIKNSGIRNITYLSGGTDLQLIDCFSNIAGSGAPNIDLGAILTGNSIQVRRYAGSIKLLNSTSSGNSVSFDFSSGRLILDSTNTAGDVIIRGVGTLEDNTITTGITVNRSGFIEGDDIIHLRNFIYIDTVDGISGTSENVGLSTRPVNNIADATIIAIERQTKAFKIRTPTTGVNKIVLSQTYNGYIFESIISPATAIISLNGQNINDCQFNGVAMSGSCLGGIFAKDSVLSDVSGFAGVVNDCSLTGMITPLDIGEVIFEDCFSLTTNLTPNLPTINMGNMSNRNVQVRNYGGNLSVTNLVNSGATLSLGMNNSNVTLDTSNTDGTLNIAGFGVLIDSSVGTTINQDNFVNPKYLDELHRLQGLNADTPMTVTQTTRVAGDISLAISGDGETTSTVTRI